MPSPEIHDPAAACTRISANQIRIDRAADALLSHLDALVQTAIEEDWSGVARESEALAEQSRAAGHRAVSALAKRVCHEAHQPQNATGIRRSLIRLIGTCGRVSERG